MVGSSRMVRRSRSRAGGRRAGPVRRGAALAVFFGAAVVAEVVFGAAAFAEVLFGAVAFAELFLRAAFAAVFFASVFFLVTTFGAALPAAFLPTFRVPFLAFFAAFLAAMRRVALRAGALFRAFDRAGAFFLLLAMADSVSSSPAAVAGAA